MTSDVFRADPERVSAFRQLLQNSILADAIVCLKDEAPAGDVHRDADAISSVRVLSGQTGWASAIEMLLSLAEPLPPPQQEEVATFQVDKAAIERQAQSLR